MMKAILGGLALSSLTSGLDQHQEFIDKKATSVTVSLMTCLLALIDSLL
jgi:hypothetical protein